MPEIKKIKLKNGKIRYRAVVDIGQNPETGARKQHTITKDRRKDVAEEIARIGHQRHLGDYVAPSNLTVDRGLDIVLPALCIDVEQATAANFHYAMRPVRVRLGNRLLQSIEENDIDELVQWMLTEGRVRGGKPGTGLGIRAVSLTLGRLRAVLNEAVRRKLVVRNVAAHTRIPRSARKDAAAVQEARRPWGTDEVRAFLVGIREARLFAIMLLSLMGMRPAEVCGVRWRDVDLDVGTLRVANTRTLVDGEMVEKTAKSRAGMRELPLPAPVVAALRTLRKRQAAERLAFGPGYAETGYVLVDEAGEPWRTDALRRHAYRLMGEVGVRRVRLYDARHSCLTELAAAGVPPSTLAAWAGHADGGALALRVYVHPNTDHLRGASDVLAEWLG